MMMLLSLIKRTGTACSPIIIVPEPQYQLLYLIAICIYAVVMQSRLSPTISAPLSVWAALLHLHRLHTYLF